MINKIISLISEVMEKADIDDDKIIKVLSKIEINLPEILDKKIKNNEEINEIDKAIEIIENEMKFLKPLCSGNDYQTQNWQRYIQTKSLRDKINYKIYGIIESEDKNGFKTSINVR